MERRIQAELAILLLVNEGSDEALAALRAEQPAVASSSLDDLRAARQLLQLVAAALEGRRLEEMRRAAAVVEERGGSVESTTFSVDGPTVRESARERPEERAHAFVEIDERRITLTEYAALSAACGAFPRRLREMHARFGIADEAARRRLDEAWTARFGEDALLEQLWQTLRAQLRAWLVQYGEI
jgi:hypothetical protein